MTTHLLPAADDTVRVGIIDQAFEPVLGIDSGDEVVFGIWGSWKDGVKPGMRFEDIRALKQAYQGKGPHTITGPVSVRGAKPGMALKVDVLELVPCRHGYNLILPGAQTRGLLADEFPEGEIRHFELDPERMTTEFCPGLTLPLRPFLGIMGVAPAQAGAHLTSYPGNFGGNIDCPELVEGSTMYLPVWVDGARFYAGDAHAMQGCGEVTQTALEPAMTRARLRISLAPELRLERPRAETARHVITLGFDPDLREAARQATHDMVDLIVSRSRLSRSQAYTLCSLKVDLMVTQAVNGVNGVHARLDKAVLEQLA